MQRHNHVAGAGTFLFFSQNPMQSLNSTCIFYHVYIRTEGDITKHASFLIKAQTRLRPTLLWFFTTSMARSGFGARFQAETVVVQTQSAA